MAWAHKPGERPADWREVTLEASPARALALTAMAVGLGVFGGAAAFGYFGVLPPGSKGWLAGWICLILAPVAIVVTAARAMARGAVVTVGPRGIRDVRLSPDWIPWAAITGISERSIRGTHFLS